MAKKAITIFMLICFVLYEYGCTSQYAISNKDIQQQSDEKIVKVVMNDGTVYEFPQRSNYEYGDRPEGARLVGNTIIGKLKDGTEKTLALDDVRMIYIKKFNAVKTILYTIGCTVVIGGIIVVIVLATKESCPFIYSYDGTKYVFDGEPYGGSVCEALERTDYCRLDSIKPVDGQYRLKLTNEVDETQYTDELKLWVVDTPVDVFPVPDAQGHLYTIAKPLPPLSATDRQGTDITRWIAVNDERYWEHDLRTLDSNATSDLRDTLTMQFARSDHSANGKLVVNISNTLWASQMLKRDLELWGSEVNSWYTQLKEPTIRSLFDAWHQREEVFRLQVRVLEGDTWMVRGEILGGGPFVTEERIVPLDLSRVGGDTVQIRLTPPVGFWQMNSIAIDYSAEASYEFQEISAATITDQQGKDLRAALDSIDHVYYTQPQIGDAADLFYPAPPMKPGTQRTIFTKASGYYDIHLKASGPVQYEQRNKIAYEPGYFVKYSLQEYFRWREHN
jgi:hypothetical protein